MERVVRYPNAKRALEVGNFLANSYTPEFLKALIFFEEPRGTVILVAVFDDRLLGEEPVILNVYMLPGEVIKRGCRAVVESWDPKAIIGVYQGLPAWQNHCKVKLGITLGE